MNAASWIAMAVGALAYWLTRYDRDFAPSIHKLGFGEYLHYQWPALIYGAIGGVVLCGVYVYAGEQILLVLGRLWSTLEGLALPSFNVVFAFGFGFVGKSFVDRVPRIVNWFGAHVRLPGAK